MTEARREALKARHEVVKANAANRLAMDKCVRYFEQAVFTPATPNR